MMINFADLLEKLEKGDNFANKEHEPMYGGAYYDVKDKLVYIKKVIHNGPACIVLWNDGDKTISTCEQEDTYNPEMGLMVCILKKMLGNKWVSKLFRDWGTTNYKVRTLTDVRRDQRGK